MNEYDMRTYDKVVFWSLPLFSSLSLLCFVVFFLCRHNKLMENIKIKGLQMLIII